MGDARATPTLGSRVVARATTEVCQPPAAKAAVAFFDLAGYTTMTLVHGDESAADIAERFSALVKAALDTDDELIKSIGDGALVVSATATGLAALAHRVCAALDAEPAFPVLRVGLHSGALVRRADDVFGAAVNTAARVAALAAGGQVLATDCFVSDLGGAYPLRDLGPVQLRGLPEPVVLHEIELCPSPHQRMVDPVCGMAVLPSARAGQVNDDNGLVVFCSKACMRRYLA